MGFTRVGLAPAFFSDRPRELLRDGNLSVVAVRYKSGVCGLRVANGPCSLVVLPYMGQQVWFAEFHGKNLTMKSIFDEPLATTKYGDNYGALLLHCGLVNMGWEEGGGYPLHGELPFAVYDEAYVGVGNDARGRYLAVGGEFVHRNSQEYNYAYRPELRLYEGESVHEMHIEIQNRRSVNPLEYMFMCHINWLAVEGSRIVYSAPNDPDHVTVHRTELGGDSPRAKAIREYCDRLEKNPAIGDVLDSKTQTYDPEICVNYKYRSDERGWAHALQVMPGGDSCYVGFRTAELPYALRWVCRTGDEDGLGIALPSTGDHQGTTHQKANGLFNTIPPGGAGTLRFDFGYLPPDRTAEMEKRIAEILKRHS